jgi:DmsE family decaheme c-type cytochrome
MLGVGLLCATAMGAAPPADKQADDKTKTAAAADFAGAEACATCHEEVARGFASNPHRKIAGMHGAGATCESCHGAGRAHVDGGGDTTRIFNPSKAVAREIDEKCLGCHQGKHPNFERSAHGEGGVSCLGCHTIHASKQEPLLKAAQTTLCFQCHADLKAQFSMPLHHKVTEGQVLCSDCHEPHEASEKTGMKMAARQVALCTRCHTTMAGPFAHEHAAIGTEGCTACHTPHGGPNAKLLNRANVNAICTQCHSSSTNATTLAPGGSAPGQGAQRQACTSCHTDIHGSNVSPVLIHGNSKEGGAR